MTIPTRPAPPPPGTQRLANRSNRASLHQSNVQLVTTVKAPPPRPPPPKVQEQPALSKKSSGGQLLSNIFGAKKANKKGYEKTLQMQQDVKVPPKIPAPPSSLHFHHQQQQQQPRQMTDTQLISFDDDFFSSTSASPTLTQKSSSDCVSVDSFSSESYSPQNGGASGESGFEDDFSVSDFKVSSNQRNNKQINDPFDSLDHFAITQTTTPHVPSNIRNVRVNAMPPQNAISIGSASFYASTSTINSGPVITKFDDSLCNGKSLIQPQAMLSMPTIIKPTIIKGKVSPTYHQQQHQHVPLTTTQKIQPLKQLTRTVESFDEEEEDFSSLPSLPMPNCPPPPPPTNALLDDEVDLDQEKLSHGFTLYDYESDLTEDLNFKVIYSLIIKVNNLY